MCENRKKMLEREGSDIWNIFLLLWFLFFKFFFFWLKIKYTFKAFGLSRTHVVPNRRKQLKGSTLFIDFKSLSLSCFTELRWKDWLAKKTKKQKEMKRQKQREKRLTRFLKESIRWLKIPMISPQHSLTRFLKELFGFRVCWRLFSQKTNKFNMSPV